MSGDKKTVSLETVWEKVLAHFEEDASRASEFMHTPLSSLEGCTMHKLTLDGQGDVVLNCLSGISPRA